MKKVYIVLMVVCLVVLCGCGKRAKTEYNIEEFGKLKMNAEKLFDTKTKYVPEDEKYTEETYKIYSDCAKKAGLPVNTEITVRGRKKYEGQSFLITALDNEECSVLCVGDNKGNNESLFINDGESIVVKGVFSKDYKTYGVITDYEIISPDVVVEYKENILDVLEELGDGYIGSALIMGEVAEIITPADFKGLLPYITDEISSEDFPDYYVSVCAIKTTQANIGTIYIPYTKLDIETISKGEKVAFKGSLQPLKTFLHADGHYSAVYAYMKILDGFYKFNK